MRLHPRPRRADNFVEPLLPGFPSEIGSDLRRTGNQNRRITRPSRITPDGYRSTGNIRSALNDFLDGVAVTAAADIVRRASIFQNIERQQMSRGNVANMYVVANTASVSGGIVVTEQRDESSQS